MVEHYTEMPITGKENRQPGMKRVLLIFIFVALLARVRISGICTTVFSVSAE